MKILHITPEAPNSRSGGGLGVAQTVLSLVENDCVVDYIGPEISEQKYFDLYNKVNILKKSNNIILRMIDVICGHTNSRYRAWLKLQKAMDFSQYNAIVMDFTKLDYCISKKMPKMFVRVHNVEKDYSLREYASNKNVKTFFVSKLAGKHEGKIIDVAEKLIAITEKDVDRLCELYGEDKREKSIVIPVCLNGNKNILDEPKCVDGKIKILLTGSLWFGENYKGLIWFLENVYNRLDDSFELVVAGARPPEELRDKLKNYSQSTLIANPANMEQYFLESDVVIAPVFDGAGMKVKVAEALSYGRPVVGTTHAFIGYKTKNEKAMMVADTSDDFLNALMEYKNMPISKKIELSKNAKKLFQEEYSLENSVQIWRKILFYDTETNYDNN